MTERIGNLGQAIIEQMSPAERWDNMPRPLRYVRPRLFPAGAAWLRELLNDEQDALLKELADLRRQGKPENDPGIQERRAALEHCAQITKDVSLGLIELVGPQQQEG